MDNSSLENASVLGPLRRSRVVSSAASASILALGLIVGGTVQAEPDHYEAAFDRLWRHARLYESSDRFVKLFAMSGRLQMDSAWFSTEEQYVPPGQDEYYNDLLWRRFRFGFTMDFGKGWEAQLEGDFDLNSQFSEMYNRLTDAYIGYSTGKAFKIKVLKQSAGFTLDGATSSKKLMTLQRNNVTNNLWFTNEYFTGLHVGGTVDKRWSYRAGFFSASDDEEFGFEDELVNDSPGHFSLLSLGYNFAQSLEIDDALVRLDYVYNKKDEDDPEDRVRNGTRDFSQVMTLASKWEKNGWSLWTDLSMGRGLGGQSDVIGLSLMPFYSFNQYHQVLLRYTFLSSDEDDGIRLDRYENRIVDSDLDGLDDDRGNLYNEIYFGYNLFFYGHKLKWQTGLQYTTMEDDADNGGEYQGWGLTTGLRMYWY